VNPFVSRVEPDLVHYDTWGNRCHDSTGCYVQNIAAACHQTLTWDESQPSRAAAGWEDSRNFHRDGIDLIHLSVGVRPRGRASDVEPSRDRIPYGLLNAACRFRVS